MTDLAQLELDLINAIGAASTVAAIEKQGLRDAQLHQLAAMLHDAGPLHRDARAADDVDPN